jgi:hypothetical protein
LSLLQCLCCHVEVSATGRSLVQRSSTDCGVCLSVIKWKQPQHLLWVGRRGKDYETKQRKHIISIIIIFHHVLGLNRLVSASSNRLFKGLPSRLHQFLL